LNNPKTYNITLAQATEASSAAPTYFDPKVLENEWDPSQPEVLIDGALIANNPALYAYIMATEFNNK
jgi:patatin-like phospholipase/acyl hydrolase